MKLLKKRPGEVFAMLFVIGGLVLTLSVAVFESLSNLAGRGYEGGLIDGSTWWDQSGPELPGTDGTLSDEG